MKHSNIKKNASNIFKFDEEETIHNHIYFNEWNEWLDQRGYSFASIMKLVNSNNNQEFIKQKLNSIMIESKTQGKFDIHKLIIIILDHSDEYRKTINLLDDDIKKEIALELHRKINTHKDEKSLEEMFKLY